jgi:hypothetical protein
LKYTTIYTTFDNMYLSEKKTTQTTFKKNNIYIDLKRETNIL